MSLTISQYAALSSIPKRTLAYMNREGFIEDPLNPTDRIGLEFLEKVWGKKEVLRPQLCESACNNDPLKGKIGVQN